MENDSRYNIARILLRALMVFAIAFAWSTTARADCATTQGLPGTLTYGSIAVPINLAVGDVIPGTTKTVRLVGKCTSSSLFNKPVVACPQNQTAVAGLNYVYTTNVAGIGIRMRNSAGTPLQGTNSCQIESSLGTTDATGAFDVSGTIELVRTGTVSTGTLSSTTYYGTGILSTGVVLNNGSNAISIANGTAVRAVTCNVTAATASQTVSMRTANSSTLAATGAVTGKTQFLIGLTCQSGVKVNVTFSSPAGTSGVDSVVPSTGTATGVGIQLLDATNNPISLDQMRTVVNSTTGNTSVPFFAQYYRLATGAVTGTVRAAAVYTMSYQ